MKIYRIAEEDADQWKVEVAEGKALLKTLMDELKAKYSGLEVFISESINYPHTKDVGVCVF